MRKFFLLPCLLILSLRAQEPAADAEEAAPPAAELTRRASLSLGYQDGIQAAQKQMEVGDFDQSAFLEGFLLGLKREQLPLTPEEIREAMTALQAKLTAREAETAKKNLEESEIFLAINKSKEGVIVSESGLQYRILAPGEGEPLGEEGLQGRDLLVHFRGTLPDGTEFASSGEINPAKIMLDEIITGFREALSKMPLKAKWSICVPSELAYGDQRRSSKIGPNQVLLFEIEFVEALAPEVTETTASE